MSSNWMGLARTSQSGAQARFVSCPRVRAPFVVKRLDGDGAGRAAADTPATEASVSA